ncbi:unnamed protein product, partial [Rotaria sp. Silwood1]
TYKSHKTDAKSEKTSDNSAYAAVATAAAHYATIYCGDYDYGDYPYSRAYAAALAVARAGNAAACSAAVAAYFDATADVARAHDYDDARAADDYLQFATTYDYYEPDGADGAHGTDGTDGANDAGDNYSSELARAANNSVSDDDF